jgi:hypothetical protein
MGETIMGYAEVIDYNTMTATILEDGQRKSAPLRLCDGCAIFRSPFNGVDVDLQPLMRALWFCEHCKVDPDATVRVD